MVMATIRIMPLHVGKGRTESRAISDIIDYVANSQKTDNGNSLPCKNCTIKDSRRLARANAGVLKVPDLMIRQ